MLLSSVVQYLPKPYELLRDLLRHEFNYVIVDRTAFTRNGRDRLTIQYVPAWIYNASYPAWFLSEARLRACFGERYDLVCEFPGADTVQPDGGEAYFKGFQFQIKAQARRA
jgi:putative methyltransferase (TIGR04325 family)